MGYPAGIQSFGIPSESSASSGYVPVRMPKGYGTYISPHGGSHMVLASSTSSAPTSSMDVITTGMGGMKLREYQQVSCL